MRLQKYMALCGVASRRKSEEIILSGKVKVNGKIIKMLGTTINPDNDVIMVNGKVIKPEAVKVYIILNKPTGYVTTLKDEFNRRKVIDLIKGVDERVYPVGRLDYDTSGLLILTNDGDLTYKLTHPSHEIVKVYMARVEGIPKEEELNRFRNGLKIDDYITSKAKINVLKEYKNSSILEIRIHEGRNRQVRKMCASIDHPVLELKRVSFGGVELGNLKEGEWKFLSNQEIDFLKKL